MPVSPVTPETFNSFLRQIPHSSLRSQPWRRSHNPISRHVAAYMLEGLGRSDEADLMRDADHPVYWDESGIHSIPEFSKHIAANSRSFGGTNSRDRNPHNITMGDVSHMSTALWASNTDGQGPLDNYFNYSDIHPDTMASMLADYRQFKAENAEVLFQGADEAASRDFWLSRNGHGAGFLDRDMERADSDRLQDAAEAYGEFNLSATSRENDHARGDDHVTGDSYIRHSDPEEPNRPQTYARRGRVEKYGASPEGLQALFNNVIREPNNQFHKHIAAEALETAGRPKDASLIRDSQPSHYEGRLNSEDGDELRIRDGRVIVAHEPYAWPGGYPIVYFDEGGNPLCSNCANENIIENDLHKLPGNVHWEGEPIPCTNCDAAIESAYGDPEPGDGSGGPDEETRSARLREQPREDDSSETPERMSAYRAPAGGAIARGVYYEGGKLMPDMEGKFMNPPAKTPQPDAKKAYAKDASPSFKERLRAKLKKPLVVSYARSESAKKYGASRDSIYSLMQNRNREPNNPLHRYILASALEGFAHPEELQTLRDVPDSFLHYQGPEGSPREWSVHVPQAIDAPHNLNNGYGVTHTQLNRWLHTGSRGNGDRPIGNNRRLVRDGDDIHVTLHGRPVVTYHPDNTLTVRMHGYNTPTTRRTIQNVIGRGTQVTSRRGNTMVGEHPFVEGMRIPNPSAR